MGLHRLQPLHSGHQELDHLETSWSTCTSTWTPCHHAGQRAIDSLAAQVTTAIQVTFHLLYPQLLRHAPATWGLAQQVHLCSCNMERRCSVVLAGRWNKSDRPIRSGKVVLGHFGVGIGCFKVPCYWHMVWDLIVCFFGRYTKVDQDHTSCNFTSHQIKNIHSRLVGKRPSGNAEKAPSPPQVAPLCGRLPLCGEKCVRVTLQPHKFEKQVEQGIWRAVLRTNSKTAKYFSTDTRITETDRALSFQQVLA